MSVWTVDFYAPGEVADRTGFSLDTLRYYERVGLLHEIDRTIRGQRRFTEYDVLWLLMLRCLRETGMPIAQMLRYAELAKGAVTRPWPNASPCFEEHDQNMEKQIAVLRAYQKDPAKH